MEVYTNEQLAGHLKRIEFLLSELVREIEGIRGTLSATGVHPMADSTPTPPQQVADDLPAQNNTVVELLLVEAEAVDDGKVLWEPELIADEDDLGSEDAPEPYRTEVSSLALLTPSDDDDVPDEWMTTAAGVLKVLFMAAADPDEDGGFRRFCRTIHSDHSQGPRALAELRAFHWRQLRKRYEQYLHDATQPDSFSITHTVPTVVSPKDPSMKVFVSSRTRSPVPTVFRRDPKHGGQWRIEVTSL